MTESIRLKLFISYSHTDEQRIDAFTTHIKPLEDKGLIELWYDKKVIRGTPFHEHIDMKLESADIICLAVSASFLSSPECIKEKLLALKLRDTQGITVFPIILSPCAWKDDAISSLLASPKDGQPITSFSNMDEAWQDVYSALKTAIQEIISLKQLALTNEFTEFLQNTELLSKAHSHKTIVHLDDIYVYPELAKYDDLRDYEKTIKAEQLIADYGSDLKLVIAGEDQSGKTSLCKQLYAELRKRNFVPVYVSDKTGKLHGIMHNHIRNAFYKQYANAQYENIHPSRIIPIVDDFHYAIKKEEHINALSAFKKHILIVDDIFCLNLKDDRLLKSFHHFKIIEFKPSYRNKLLQKWAHLNNIAGATEGPIDITIYHNIDAATELVNAALGKIIGSGIMPAFPFYILAVMSVYETFEKPLDQEITSQGYCYQALIYIYLRKHNVKNDDIDTYINFLSEFAFNCFTEDKRELTSDEFQLFLDGYNQTYNLPIAAPVLIRTLCETQIISLDSFNNYSFNYPYLYYYFVAKYLSDHSESCLDRIRLLVENLHNNDNAYIAVFIAHHSKSAKYLELIVRSAQRMFDKYSPATLGKEELTFFDNQVDIIVEAVLPPAGSSPETERAQRLEQEDKLEHDRESIKDKDSETKGNEIVKDLKSTFRTVEVMGQIIKNRRGLVKKG